MKKMTSSKAKVYAKRLLDLERKRDKAQDKKEKESYELKILDIVDEICEEYESTAIYKVDEEVYSLAKKS